MNGIFGHFLPPPGSKGKEGPGPSMERDARKWSKVQEDTLVPSVGSLFQKLFKKKNFWQNEWKKQDFKNIKKNSK